MDKYTPPPERQFPVNFTQHQGQLCAEISDFGRDRPPYCGKCHKDLPPGRAHKDAENETTHWTVTCSCGQVHILFND